MNKWDELKNTMAIMTEYIYNGFMFPRNILHKFLEIRNSIMEEENFESPYCLTCGSCGEEGCCPPSTCKYGLNYINNMRKELEATRKTLAVYIKKAGYEPTQEIIDQEIEFYGSK